MAKYLVALSGGADSVCLLLTLLEKGEVEAAAHCNFHLRGEESERDEAFVRQLCQERGVTLHVTHFDTLSEANRTGESIEMAARRLRYEWFAQLLAETGCNAVAVGHHQEDNAETILLNLVRGTGLQGLMGMQMWSEKQGFPIYRPLLTWTKTEILQYLQSNNQPFVTDSTNADTHYRRNSIRHEVIPLLQQMNPRVVQAINAMANNLTEVNDLCKDALRHEAELCGLKPCEGKMAAYKQADWEKFCANKHRHALLRDWLAAYSFSETQLADAMNMRVGGCIENGKGIITRTEHQLIFGPLPHPIPQLPIHLPQSTGEATTTQWENATLTAESIDRESLSSLKCAPNVALLDAEKLRGTLMIRPCRQGERFQPFGMKGSQLLSDYMTNRHFSRIEKTLTPVIADDGGVVWLMGERTDRRFSIGADTKRVLRLTIHYQS